MNTINIKNINTVWEDFICGNIVINCTTKECSDVFLNYCFEQEIYWGYKIKEFEQWDNFEEETCYSVYKNRLQYSDFGSEKNIIFRLTK